MLLLPRRIDTIYRFVSFLLLQVRAHIRVCVHHVHEHSVSLLDDDDGTAIDGLFAYGLLSFFVLCIPLLLVAGCTVLVRSIVSISTVVLFL